MYMMNDREFSNRKETLHGEFYENALKYPERIALIYENEKVSYKMLRLYALRAANYMWQRGVRRNDKISVLGVGGTLVLPNPEKGPDASHWGRLLNEYKVTLWNSVPAQAESIMQKQL